jgi:STE24 endopeptidase
MLAAALAVPLALAMLRRFPRGYWLVPAALGTIWLAINISYSPFGRLMPLPEGPLRSDLVTIAASSAVPFDRLRLGEQPSLGGSFTEARVVWRGGSSYAVLGERLYNILPVEPRGISPAYVPVAAGEVRALAGHELAHIELGHLYWLPVALEGTIILLAWLAWWSSARLVAWRGSRWGLRSIADPAALPLVVACFFLASWLFVPIRNPIVLATEIQADQVGLTFSRDPDGFAALAMREARGGPIRRTFFEQLLLIDHPSDEARIRRAMEWKAANAPARWRAIGPSGPIRVRQY